ncbi:oxidoreductase [Laceyella putida]|uniref:Oxidoreductase n=1 Tax=Laceyella putida TaxID=110101 RepID=A0ABW2RHW9_9BACL
MNKTALVLGATGLIGSHVTQLLLKDNRYKEVRLLVRKSTGIHHPKCREHLIDFADLESKPPLFAVDDLFCCLGTTMKKAQSKEAFRLVDYTYPLQVGQLAKSQGIQSYSLISSIGANPRSPFFYTRTKGELEEALTALDLPALHIFRPSLLLGERQETRLMEDLAQRLTPALNPLLVGPLRAYRPIKEATVAQAMVYQAQSGLTGTHVVESWEMEKLVASAT